MEGGLRIEARKYAALEIVMAGIRESRLRCLRLWMSLGVTEGQGLKGVALRPDSRHER